MKINIIGWGHGGHQAVVSPLLQDILDEDRDNSIDYWFVNEHSNSPAQSRRSNSISVGCDVVCPHPLAARAVLSRLISERHDLKRLMQANVLVHILPLGSAFATGGFQAFQSKLSQVHAPKPFQAVFALLPGLDEDTVFAGRFLLELLAARNHHGSSMIILVDREGSLFFNYSAAHFHKLLGRIISNILKITSNPIGKHFMERMGARFAALCITHASSLFPDSSEALLLQLLSESSSINLFDGLPSKITRLDSIISLPRSSMAREIFLVSAPVAMHKEWEVRCCNTLCGIFQNARVFYLGMDGSDHLDALKNIHILFLSQPINYKILSLIQQYIEHYWKITKEQLNNMINGHSVEIITPREIIDKIDYKFIQRYMQRMLPDESASSTITCNSISLENLMQAISVFKRWINPQTKEV